MSAREAVGFAYDVATVVVLDLVMLGAALVGSLREQVRYYRWPGQ